MFLFKTDPYINRQYCILFPHRVEYSVFHINIDKY